MGTPTNPGSAQGSCGYCWLGWIGLFVVLLLAAGIVGSTAQQSPVKPTTTAPTSTDPEFQEIAAFARRLADAGKNCLQAFGSPDAAAKVFGSSIHGHSSMANPEEAALAETIIYGEYEGIQAGYTPDHAANAVYLLLLQKRYDQIKDLLARSKEENTAHAPATTSGTIVYAPVYGPPSAFTTKAPGSTTSIPQPTPTAVATPAVPPAARTAAAPGPTPTSTPSIQPSPLAATAQADQYDLYRITQPNVLITTSRADLATFVALNQGGQKRAIRDLYKKLKSYGEIIEIQAGTIIRVDKYHRDGLARVVLQGGRFVGSGSDSGYITQADLEHAVFLGKTDK